MKSNPLWWFGSIWRVLLLLLIMPFAWLYGLVWGNKRSDE